MTNKNGEIGMGTIVVWAIIIGLGILLLFITLNSTSVGQQSIEKLKDFNPWA